MRLRDVGEWLSGGTPPRDDPTYWEGDVPWASTKDLRTLHLTETVESISEEAAARHSCLAPERSILVSVRGMALAKRLPLTLIQRPMAFNQDLKAIVCRTGVTPEFLLYALVAATPRLLAATEEAAHGTKRLDTELLRSFTISVPEENEQRRIADYLDHETRRLEHIARSKSDLLFHLQRRVDAAIFQSLEALDQYRAPLRRFSCDIQIGPFGSQLHAADYIEEGVPIINPSNLIDHRVVPRTGASVGSDAARRLDVHRLKKGDVVFARRGELGRSAVAGPEAEGWLCGTGCLRVRFLDERVDSRYLKFAVRDPRIAAYFHVRAVGSTMGNLNTDAVAGLPLVLPPSTEIQARVAGQLEAVVDCTVRLIRKIERSQRLLTEHREALITAAVTGQLDVTRDAPSPPEEALEPA